MHIIKNANGLYLQQGKSDDYSFTSDADSAIKFIAEENAALKIKKLPLYTGLKAVPLKEELERMQNKAV